jgi:hypothetical protein
MDQDYAHFPTGVAEEPYRQVISHAKLARGEAEESKNMNSSPLTEESAATNLVVVY